MEKQVLGIDIDGTLTEYDSFLPYLNELLGTKVKPEEIIQYDLHEIFGMEYDAFSSLFDEHSIPLYQMAVPRPCALQELQWLDKRFEIIYITARYGEFRELTQNWIIQHGFPDRQLICTGSHDKLSAIKENQVRVMVEDRLENAFEIWGKLQVPVFLLDTPYNQGMLPSGICRVKDWHEIIAEMKK